MADAPKVRQELTSIAGNARSNDFLVEAINVLFPRHDFVPARLRQNEPDGTDILDLEHFFFGFQYRLRAPARKIASFYKWAWRDRLYATDLIPEAIDL